VGDCEHGVWVAPISMCECCALTYTVTDVQVALCRQTCPFVERTAFPFVYTLRQAV
jgi:hypothetical protein